MSTIESLLSQLGQAANTADLSMRYRLSRQLQRLARSIATPRQSIQHYGYLYTEQVVAKAASDLDIFSILAQSAAPMTTADISSKSGGDAALISRILKHLASTYTITEVGESTFAANETTRILASPQGKGSLVFGFNILNKAFQELPKYLKDKGYQSPDQPLDTAFHQAFDTKEQFFLFLQQDPESMQNLHASLGAFDGPVSWTTVVPLDEKLQNSDENTVLLVDIGGGPGLQCAEFRKAIAGRFIGRVVNQDLPNTLARAPNHEGVEMMVQDFYQKQQIRGARIYIIRRCLHDLPDQIAKQVLQHIRDAMSPQSFLLIDELVPQATDASPFAMQVDITMMAMFASGERTVPQWRKLLGEVGLEITQVYNYDPEIEYSVLEAIPTRARDEQS